VKEILKVDQYLVQIWTRVWCILFVTHVRKQKTICTRNRPMVKAYPKSMKEVLIFIKALPVSKCESY